MVDRWGGGTPLCSRASRIHDWPGRTCRKEAGTSWIATCGIIEANLPLLFACLLYDRNLAMSLHTSWSSSGTHLTLKAQPEGRNGKHIHPNSDARTPKLPIFSRVLIFMQHMKPSTSLVPTSIPLLRYPRVSS